jgi:hypothetical protein
MIDRRNRQELVPVWSNARRALDTLRLHRLFTVVHGNL